MQVSWYSMYGGQRAVLWIWFSPFYPYMNPGKELGLSGLHGQHLYPVIHKWGMVVGWGLWGPIPWH